MQLFLSVVLCMSGLMYGMRTSSSSSSGSWDDGAWLFGASPSGNNSQKNEFLYVRVGGCSIQPLGAQGSRYVCKSIYREGDEFICSIVADSGQSLSVIKDVFFDGFKRELSGNKSIEECLENAYKKCIITKVEEKQEQIRSAFFISCFSLDSQQLSLLRVGNINGLYGGKHYQSTHEFENLHEPSCFGYEYSDDFGYYVGASEEFWKVIKRKEVPQLLLNAQKMESEIFYSTYKITNDKHLSSDVLLYDDEDKDVAEIAKKLVEVAMIRGAGEDIAIVIKLFGSQSWNLDSCHSTASSSNSDDFYDDFSSGDDNAYSVDQLRKLAATIDIEQFISNTSSIVFAETASSEEIEDVNVEQQMQQNTEEQVLISVETTKQLDVEGSVEQNVEQEIESSTKEQALFNVEITEQSTIQTQNSSIIKKDTTTESVAPKTSWRSFIGNHKFFVGGCVVALLAAMVVAYKYHCLPLNYMRV